MTNEEIESAEKELIEEFEKKMKVLNKKDNFDNNEEDE